MTLMEIEIATNTGSEIFQVKDYVHDDTHRCKLEVFRSGEFVASFEPGKFGHLHICKKTSAIPDALLHQIAEKLESFNL